MICSKWSQPQLRGILQFYLKRARHTRELLGHDSVSGEPIWRLDRDKLKACFDELDSILPPQSENAHLQDSISQILELRNRLEAPSLSHEEVSAVLENLAANVSGRGV